MSALSLVGAEKSAMDNFGILVKHAYIIVTAMMRRGTHFEDACAVLGLPPRPMKDVSLEERIQSEKLFDACHRLNEVYGDKLFCLKTGTNVLASDFGLWGQYLSFHNTLHDAWDSMIQMFGLFSSFGTLYWLDNGSEMIVACSNRGQVDIERASALLELRLGGALGLSRTLTGQLYPDLISRVYFEHSPRVLPDAYVHACDCPVEFNCDFLGFAIPKKYLDTPFLSADPDMKRIVEQKIRGHNVGDDNQFSQLVADKIRQQLPDALSLKALSEQVNMSESSVKRRLRSENTSFGELATKVRNDLAISKLRNRHKSIHEVAMETGYSSVSSFSQAFKRTNNATPSAFRKALLDK